MHLHDSGDEDDGDRLALGENLFNCAEKEEHLIVGLIITDAEYRAEYFIQTNHIRRCACKGMITNSDIFWYLCAANTALLYTAIVHINPDLYGNLKMYFVTFLTLHFQWIYHFVDRDPIQFSDWICDEERNLMHSKLYMSRIMQNIISSDVPIPPSE